MVELVNGPRTDLLPDVPKCVPISVDAIDAIDAIDVSHAVVYLLSDEARFVTGTELKVETGITGC